MRTVATLLFIAAAAVAAVLLFQKKTVIDGKVMAADLLGQLSPRGITEIVCDPNIPIDPAGAVFHCDVAATDGSTAKIKYTMNREGSLAGEVVDGTGPSKPAVPASSDPWAN